MQWQGPDVGIESQTCSSFLTAGFLGYRHLRTSGWFLAEHGVGIHDIAGTKSMSDGTAVISFSKESGNSPQYMNEISKNGKFEIIEYQKDDDAYFYSDTDYSYYVTSTETGDELFAFYGHSYSGRNGTDEAGTKKVSFDNDDCSIIVDYYDGNRETYELPVDVWFADKGKAILLRFADDRIEKRVRRAVTHFSKYGQPSSRTLKMPGKHSWRKANE